MDAKCQSMLERGKRMNGGGMYFSWEREEKSCWEKVGEQGSGANGRIQSRSMHSDWSDRSAPGVGSCYLFICAKRLGTPCEDVCCYSVGSPYGT